MSSLCVAIDGPAGAGKSTVARLVAKELHMLYVDTGAMYRALTWLALAHGVERSDEHRLLALLPTLSIDLTVDRSVGQRVMINGQDITGLIRSPDIDRAVSWVSSIAPVRDWMVKAQKTLASRGGVVMDGRDIGTHVLPSAEVKVYLTASLEERAKRRVEDMRRQGLNEGVQQVANSLRERDYLDENRVVAPARMASDAIHIDTTGFSVEEVVSQIVSLCRAYRDTAHNSDEYNGVSS